MAKSYYLSLVLLVLITAAPLSAQQTTEEETYTPGRVSDQWQFQWSNGKAWKVLDLQSRIELL